MADSLTGVALFIVAVTALGLFKVLRSRIAIERMMAIQLLGTGGAAALLLLGAATSAPALTDVALLLMLLSAFSCAAFTLGDTERAVEPASEAEDPS